MAKTTTTTKRAAKVTPDAPIETATPPATTPDPMATTTANAALTLAAAPRPVPRGRVTTDRASIPASTSTSTTVLSVMPLDPGGYTQFDAMVTEPSTITLVYRPSETVSPDRHGVDVRIFWTRDGVRSRLLVTPPVIVSPGPTIARFVTLPLRPGAYSIGLQNRDLRAAVATWATIEATK